jgi:hypothetical protein
MSHNSMRLAGTMANLLPISCCNSGLERYNLRKLLTGTFGLFDNRMPFGGSTQAPPI